MSYPKLTPIIAKGATEPRYLEDRFADIINVKDFGAKGDGVTDDADAFQAAAESRGTYPVQVFVPAGTYYLSRDPVEPATASENVNAIFWYIDAGVTITGEGKLCNYPVYMGWPTNWYLNEFLPIAHPERTGSIKNSMRIIETDLNPITRTALTLTTQTKQGLVDSDYAGFQSLVVNNNENYKSRSWAGYFESTRMTDTAGNTLGIEVTIADASPNGSSDITPYGQLTVSDGADVEPYHASVLIWGGGGGELEDLSNQNDISALMGFSSGGSSAKQGIVFGNESLVFNNDSFGNALAMASRHGIRWYAGKTEKTAGIWCGVTSGNIASELHFANNYTRFVTRDWSNNTLYTAFQIMHSQIDINGLKLTPGTGYFGPVLEPVGTPENLDLRLRGKGAGHVRFGTYTESSTSATGYITIKDIDGNTRHLLCW